jgi:hypothetical protein
MAAPPALPRPGTAKHSAPPRPRHGRARLLVASVVTVVILLGYGGVKAWDALFGVEAPATAAPETGFVGIANRLAATGQYAIDAGINLRILKDGALFIDAMSRYTAQVQSDRADLARRADGATGVRADILASSLRAADALELGMAQWRDGVVNLRIGTAANGETAIRSAIAQLGADAARWDELRG